MSRKDTPQIQSSVAGQGGSTALARQGKVQKEMGHFPQKGQQGKEGVWVVAKGGPKADMRRVRALLQEKNQKMS
ncbi:hypothetical protein Dimus_020445, partial [Dionaea muscipula]